jgi:integrase
MNLVLDTAVVRGYLMLSQRPVMQNTGEASGRRPDFSEQEVKTLIQYLPTWVKAGHRGQTRNLRELLAIYIPFVAITGMRPGTETEYLEWRHIELRDNGQKKYLYCNVLKGKTAKKGKRMGFVMDDACAPLLSKLVEIAPEFKNKTLQQVLSEQHPLPLFRTRTGSVPEKPPIQFKQLLQELDLLDWSQCLLVNHQPQVQSTSVKFLLLAQGRCEQVAEVFLLLQSLMTIGFASPYNCLEI